LLRVRPLTLLAASSLLAALLLSMVLVPQMAARTARVDMLRQYVAQVARLAASNVDGDLHRRLLDGTADEATLQAARAPLLRMHAAQPEIRYFYTMGVRDGMPFFVLDTAQDAAFAASRGLTASAYMSAFSLREEYRDNWLERLAAGQVYVTPGFQFDDYGQFLSGHAPIFDSQGQFSGFVGVDFTLDYYQGEELRFSQIEIFSIIVALMLALGLGYAYARRQYEQQAELHHHYRSSMQDALTGLRNRRGATAAIEQQWSLPDAESHAALLVDIDRFKGINDSLGHRVGDDVLRALAAALRGSMRPGDVTARLGGDEFLIFARGCDRDGAEHIAERLLGAVRAVQAPVPFTVSVGVAVTAGLQGGFDLLYRQADAALYAAKNAGRDQHSVYGGETDRGMAT